MAGYFQSKFKDAGIEAIVYAAVVQDGPAVLMGSSLGGYLTALNAARNPERV